MERRFVLSPGTQVRKEDFGLLFYTMAGPRLYFLPSQNLLDESFFENEGAVAAVPEKLVSALNQLKEKGVINEL